MTCDLQSNGRRVEVELKSNCSYIIIASSTHVTQVVHIHTQCASVFKQYNWVLAKGGDDLAPSVYAYICCRVFTG